MFDAVTDARRMERAGIGEIRSDFSLDLDRANSINVINITLWHDGCSLLRDGAAHRLQGIGATTAAASIRTATKTRPSNQRKNKETP